MSTLATASPVDALQHCEMITRTRARNFYYGLKLLPEPRRSAMYALYAWMRAADDLVDGGDGSTDGTMTDLIEGFRRDTTNALHGNPSDDDPMWIGLAYAAERFNLREEMFHAMLAGQLDDVSDRRYHTFDQSREYCYRVASTVGLLCIEVWGYNDPAAKDLAIERGIAFQLTNIIRDFKEDFDTGRIYLPDEDFEMHGLTAEDLYNWADPKGCDLFIRYQVDRAASFYEHSRDLDEMIEPECRPTLWAMTTIYRRLLRKISLDPSRLVSDRKVRLGWATKAAIAVRATMH